MLFTSISQARCRKETEFPTLQETKTPENKKKILVMYKNNELQKICVMR